MLATMRNMTEEMMQMQAQVRMLAKSIFCLNQARQAVCLCSLAGC
jgi:hypothetical protein